jgi:ABC-type multidrug transport system ATPase subunit
MSIYRGVCPQDNVLWESLTASEHLSFYGKLKGMSGDRLSAAIETGLKQVTLWDVKNKKAGEFSGGMKRRLCVAIALIGDPKIVLLDEPTTGLDPDARRRLWEVIKSYKKNTCILLTTHRYTPLDSIHQ